MASMPGEFPSPSGRVTTAYISWLCGSEHGTVSTLETPSFPGTVIGEAVADLEVEDVDLFGSCRCCLLRLPRRGGLHRRLAGGQHHRTHRELGTSIRDEDHKVADQ